MEFRRLSEGDLESLLSLYVQLDGANADLSLEKSKPIWREIERAGNIEYFGAVEDGKVVGACFVSIIPNLTMGGRSIAFVENVVVDAEQRKRGIGKAIIGMAIEHAKKKDCYKVILQSGMQRKEAHRFYEGIGFDGDRKRAFDLRI